MDNSKEYKERIKRHAPASPLAKDTLLAFLFGGGICLLGELLATGFMSLGAERENSYIYVSVVVILTACILTSFGIFDKIARYAGAGTLVPVCGFANSVASSALDSRYEGYVLGVGAKIFVIAGPVILYATVSGVLYGIIYFISGLFV